MRMPSIINHTAISCAKGAAYGAAYGALINPVMGVGAGAVLGAVALSTEFLFLHALTKPFRSSSQPPITATAPTLISNDMKRTNYFMQLFNSVGSIRRPWVQAIATISLIFAGAVIISALMMYFPTYAGLYAGKYALAALGFKAIIAPSQTLVVNFFWATYACNRGVGMAISSVKFLWNNTFSRAPQGQLDVPQ